MIKRHLLPIITLFLAMTFAGTACKKIIHSGAPTPNNVRMKAYQKFTTIELSAPGSVTSTITEDYRFYYDAVNRLSRIVYTGNDTFQIQKEIEFKYAGDSVYKKTTNIITGLITEMDTFINNGSGLLVTAYTPNEINTFEYYGDLLSRRVTTGTSYRNISMTTENTYTSVDGDFLKNNTDGNLNVSFNDVTVPLDFHYLQALSPTILDTPSYTNYNSLTQTKANYNFQPIYLHMMDATGLADSVTFAGADWSKESYHFYTEDANRTGDWLQLLSFTMYGNNIYRNKHLVESISQSNKNAAISYKIDANNMITQTNVTITDSSLSKYIYRYDIQYETY